MFTLKNLETPFISRVSRDVNSSEHRGPSAGMHGMVPVDRSYPRVGFNPQVSDMQTLRLAEGVAKGDVNSVTCNQNLRYLQPC